MAHRHLYAHTSGLITDKYLHDWRRLTGEDLSMDAVSAGYPNEEKYWFRPLKQLDAFVEDVRSFFHSFPAT